MSLLGTPPISSTPAERSAVPPFIPEHELLSPIASGAYGEVWLGRNAVGTLRAIKIVRRDRHASEDSFAREFKGLQKFEPISRTHEGFVDILTLGMLHENTGFYYVMELADSNPVGDDVTRLTSSTNYQPRPIQSEPANVGSYTPHTLRAELGRRGALPANEVIALGLKLAHALVCLHGHGLLHRDVKPSNILFIRGEPKLADAGLVTALDDARSLVGTAGYIAPEGPGTPQADLYALGKVLYETAFGKDRQEFPALPADVASRRDHPLLLELNCILLKACATGTKERYQSAADLETDLQLLATGRSVKRKHAWLNRGRQLRSVSLVAAAIGMGFLVYLNAFPQKPHTLQMSANPAANEDYREGFRAMHASSEDGPGRAIEHFKHAIERDPKFAAAYMRLAQCCFFMGGSGPARLITARDAVQKALALDPKMSEAHAISSGIKRRLDLDWRAAEEELRLALTLNPASPDTLYEAALGLSVVGRKEEAVRALEKALSLDPESASVTRLRHAGHVYTWCHEYDKGITKYNEVLRDNPDGARRIEGALQQAWLARGSYLEAIRHGRNAFPYPDKNALQAAAHYDALERAFQQNGEPGYWAQELVFENSRTDDNHLMRLAAIYARLHRLRDSIEILTRAYNETPTEFAFNINTNPAFDHVRGDPDFERLIQNLWHKK
jgi:serine/threonine protein kinase